MSNITFADVIHQTISFSKDLPEESLVLDLLDTKWMQRLRDISQTANTRLVYMCSEHSRFGHSLGVAYIAKMLLEKLKVHNSVDINKYSKSVLAAALMHDIGHIAPGSHTAFKAWFPQEKDAHEQVSVRIIKEDPEINALLNKYSATLMDEVVSIIEEKNDVPAWSWEIISGGGWNVDRGNWCMLDSILAGVSYGKYNIPALLESIIITNDKHLALMENRLDSMMHFAVSRHAMYRQVYQHRVLLAADCLNKSIVARARYLKDTINFSDSHMEAVLAAKTPHELSLDNLYHMRESWWKYHLMQWINGDDKILADLSERLLNRKLFKTIRIAENDDKDKLKTQAINLLKEEGLDPSYYLHEVTTQEVHTGDSKQSMLVQMDNGKILQIGQADPLFNTLVSESKTAQKSWLVMPAEIKRKIGRDR
jgi:HD superfamily phosphohydrolase